MARIIVTGARGQLGAELGLLLAEQEPVLLAREDLDLTDTDTVDRRIDELRPEIVLNAAAWNHVDRAEEEPLEAFRANALGPRNLALACARHDTLLVHFSTDYVFSGDANRPWREEDLPFPRSAYGTSKLAGEHFVRALAATSMIIRTSGLYGLHGHGGKGTNFVETMLRLARERSEVRVVDDQVLTPTWTRDLAAKAIELVDAWRTSHSPDLAGLYHVTNSGQVSWRDFARKIFELARIDVKVEAITTREFDAKAPRPAFSVLDHGHLRELGMESPRPWQEALAAYLHARG